MARHGITNFHNYAWGTQHFKHSEAGSAAKHERPFYSTENAIGIIMGA